MQRAHASPDANDVWDSSRALCRREIHNTIGERRFAMTAADTRPTGADASNAVKRKELIVDIRDKRLVVVTGTGVTLQSVGYPAVGTEVAGWPGLLNHGLEYCRRERLIDNSHAKVVDVQIKSQETDEFINAAQKIHECLATRTNGRQWWMKESVGSLTVTDSRLIKSIVALNGLVTTLNYDTTIQQVTGRPALHWKQQAEITKRIRDHAIDYTLHIHGVCDVVDSIVLDRTSYDMIAKDVKMQGLLHRFARFDTMLFIGCRQTFLDPNFQTLLNWAQIGLAGAEHRHFILCRSSEEASILEELRPHGYLTPLVYGDQHSDLAPFLEALALEALGASATANPPTLPQAPAAVPATANVLRPSDIWQLHLRP